jgi:hypothetical protein
LKKSLSELRESCDLAEAHRYEIEDADARMYSFGLLDVNVCFSTAARICTRLWALKEPCDAGSWAMQALSFIERGKARSLLDALSTWDDTFPSDLKNAVRSFGEDIAESSLATNQIGRDLDDERLCRITKTLPDTTLVVVISYSDEGITILTVRKTELGPPIWVEVEWMEVVNSVESYLANIQIDPSKERTHETKKQLRKCVEKLSSLIIAPLTTEIKDAEDLIFIPSGCLFRFPFSALEFNGEPMFMHDKSTVIYPSLAVFEVLFKRSECLTSSSDELASTIIVSKDKSLTQSEGTF